MNTHPTAVEKMGRRSSFPAASLAVVIAAGIFMPAALSAATVHFVTIPAEVREVEGDTAMVAVGTVEIALPAHGIAPGPAKVAVRPESVQLSDPGNGLAGEIVKAAYLGDHLEYSVSTPVGELFVIDNSVDAPRAVGSSVSVGFGTRVALVPGGD